MLGKVKNSHFYIVRRGDLNGRELILERNEKSFSLEMGMRHYENRFRIFITDTLNRRSRVGVAFDSAGI